MAVEPLEIDWASQTLEQQDASVDVSHDFSRGWSGGRRLEVPGTRLTIRVAYRGDADLFRLTPMTFTGSFPQAAVKDGNVVIRLVVPHPADPEAVKAEVKRQRDLLTSYAGWSRQEVEAFNASLRATIRTAVEARREKLLADRDLAVVLGIPMARPEEQRRTCAAPVVPSRRPRQRRPGSARRQCRWTPRSPTRSSRRSLASWAMAFAPWS